MSRFKGFDIYHRENIALLREHYKKAVFSPDRRHKAQIYFEYDYQNTGTYADFSALNSSDAPRRVQFTPSGWSVVCNSIGDIRWLSNEIIKINHIQVCKNSKDADCNTKYYWLISINGQVEYRCANADDPHLLFELGKRHYEGKIILLDQEKGLQLIQESARKNYQHAQNWLKFHLCES